MQILFISFASAQHKLRLQSNVLLLVVVVVFQLSSCIKLIPTKSGAGSPHKIRSMMIPLSFLLDNKLHRYFISLRLFHVNDFT